MTREEARKAAEVMLAYANGERIECAARDDSNNWEKTDNPSFKWDILDYRVFNKPKPKFDPKTLQPFDKVLVRCDAIWGCDFFSHTMDSYNQTRYICTVGMAAMVIPYNDETKHLVGTSEEVPEFYRYWEE